jgi:chromosome segregation ATPase
MALGLRSPLNRRNNCTVRSPRSFAEAEQVESEITETRSALGASQQKAQELKNDLASTEAELANYSEEAIEQSVLEAAKIWHLKGKSPHNSSIVENAISRVVEAEASIRILNARLVWLKDLLAKEEAKIESFKQELKRLEKQLS